jgi:AcrB/AcrD/AcrF family
MPARSCRQTSRRVTEAGVFRHIHRPAAICDRDCRRYYALAGLIAIRSIPIAQFPDIVPPFAVEQRQSGKEINTAPIEAASLRIRPVMMTSFAFIFGLFPLIAQGAGATTRHAMGTPVFGGMIAASVFGIFLGWPENFAVTTAQERHADSTVKVTEIGDEPPVGRDLCAKRTPTAGNSDHVYKCGDQDDAACQHQDFGKLEAWD